MEPRLIEKILNFKALVLDVDGVFFTGNESRLVLPDGEVVVMKDRSHQDGQGLSFLRAIGIKILFSTGEGEPINSVIRKLNSLSSVTDGQWSPISLFTNQLGVKGKVPSVQSWLIENDLSWGDVIYIGDDRTDLEVMQKVSMKLCPNNATRLIRKISDIILTKDGGKGAIREFSELVLDIRGVKESDLPSS